MKIKSSILLLLLIIFITSPFISVSAEEFLISSCPATTDLFDHMSEQIDDRIEGVSGNDAGKALFSTRGNLTSPWVLSSTAWTTNGTPLDFTGMSPWNSQGGYTRAGTLITPRHIALANHYTVSIGDTVLFVASDNSVVTRTVSSVQRVLATDISIAKLDSDVPSSIRHYPILDKTTYEAYLSDGYNMSTYNLPLVMFDQDDHAIIRNTHKDWLVDKVSIIHTPATEGARSDFNETLIGGDSGNPGFVLIGDTPVLVLTHFTAGSGPSYPYYKSDIRDVIDSMGGSYTLSTIDLSCFNAPIVLDKTSIISAVADSANGTSAGTVGIKYNIENDTPYFSFVSGNSDGALAINSATGEITTASSTLVSSPNFPRSAVIKVEEGGPGGRASIATYTINLVSYPYFTDSEYSFVVDEHSATNTVLGTIGALDAQNNALEYSITSGNDAGIFAIDSSTGVITVANSALLNYETATEHTLVVQVMESSTLENLSQTTSVNISVVDTNYSFSEDSYIFEIDETDADEINIGSVLATIVDSMEISEIYYQISSGNDDGIFAINSTTGEITIADSTNLDGNDIYNLTIGVSDGQGNQVLNSVSVVVQVTMDARPSLFFESNSTSPVTYSVTEGSSVTLNFYLSGAYSKSIIADLAQTSGSAVVTTDYSLSTSTLTFLPGETTKSVTLSAVQDSSNESDETVQLDIIDNIRVTFGLNQGALITIQNNRVASSGGGGGGGGGSSSSSSSSVITTTVDTPIVSVPLNTDFVLPTTMEGLLTLLASLQAQLAALIMSQSLSTASSLPAVDLELNSEGPLVTVLQNYLISKGFSIPAGATGFFGPQTQQALIRFQQATGITPASGYYGPKTRALIDTF